MFDELGKTFEEVCETLRRECIKANPTGLVCLSCPIAVWGTKKEGRQVWVARSTWGYTWAKGHNHIDNPAVVEFIERFDRRHLDDEFAFMREFA